jgi:hypothetical protein
MKIAVRPVDVEQLAMPAERAQKLTKILKGHGRDFRGTTAKLERDEFRSIRRLDRSRAPRVPRGKLHEAERRPSLYD